MHALTKCKESMATVSMAKILHEISLSEFAESFQREKITPDIVPKLSLEDFLKLGLTNRAKILNLRTKCCFYGSLSPTKFINDFGKAPFFSSFNR